MPPTKQGDPSPVLVALTGFIGGALFTGFISSFVVSFFSMHDSVAALAASIGISSTTASPSTIAMVGGGLIGGVAGAVSNLRRRSWLDARKKVLEAFAAANGGTFAAGENREVANTLSRFFAEKRSFIAANVLRFEPRGVAVTLADITYEKRSTSGKNRSSRQVMHTVAWHAVPEHSIPRFEMQPEGVLLSALGAVAGVKDIDFAHDPHFSKSYHLHSDDEAGVRRLFTPRVLAAIGATRDLCVASEEGEVVIYRKGDLCPPDRLQAFAAEAAEIFQILESAAAGEGR